jgi:hypothetical protein
MSEHNERNNKTPKILEDGPKYRSVAMMTRQPVTLQQGLNEPRLKQAPYQTIDPTLRGAKPLLQRQEQAKLPSTWTVHNLIAVPGFHKLERTHVVVNDVKPYEVARRIVEVVSSLSVAAVYDDKQVSIAMNMARS